MKKSIVLVLILSLVLSLGGCAQETTENVSPTETPPVTSTTEQSQETSDDPICEPLNLIWADYHATTTTFWGNVEYWAELVNEKSDGAITVELYPAAQLGTQAELVEAVRSGDIHITYAGTGINSNYVTEFQVTELPFIWDDYDHIERVLFEGELGEILTQKLIEETGLRTMSWIHSGFRDMYTTIPVNSMDDLQSVKMRAPEAALYIALFDAIGAAATPLAWNDVYESVRSGLVEGLETTQEGFISNSLYEVAPNVIITNHMYTAESPIMNEEFYQSLTDTQRQIIDESFEEMADWFNPQQIEFTENAYDRMRDEFGCDIYTPDRAPFQEACEKVWDSFKTDVPNSNELLELVDAGR